MREITNHRVNPVNDLLAIHVVDEPGAGGAHHRYAITVPGREVEVADDPSVLLIDFQNGPIPDAGVNGVTQEALLAIIIDRDIAEQAEQAAKKKKASCPVIRRCDYCGGKCRVWKDHSRGRECTEDCRAGKRSGTEQ